MNDVSTARDIMIIIWKDPNMKLHGKRHKRNRFYFRWHYGKQRRVCMYTEYVDKPTEKQVSAREAFTELRREVARQLRDAVLREAWERRFAEDNEGYKFLHTYVYAKLKAPSNSPIKGELEAELSRESLSYGETEAAISSMRRATVSSLQATPTETRLKGVSTSGTEQRCRSTEVQKFRGVEVRRFRRGCVDDEGDAQKGVSTSGMPIIMIHNGVIVPIFLPNEVPKRECLQV